MKPRLSAECSGRCRKYGIDPNCPRHGRGVFARNLVGATVLAAVAALAVATAGVGGAGGAPAALAICDEFGDRYCGPALRVAWCESRLDVTARNGQYRGLFQMGSWERARFGHGRSAREQARAAYRYFVATGRDWSPWECQP